MERKTFLFSTTVVVQEIELTDILEGYRHRLIIGTIASEWASFRFLAYLNIGGRTFVSCIDGRSIFPRCFEVIGGLERL